MMFEKLKEWLNQPENIEKTKFYFNKIKINKETRISRANRLLEWYGVCDNATFDELMLVLLDKQKTYDARHYRTYTERPLNIIGAIWELVQQDGVAIEPFDDFTKNFPSAIYNFNGYQFGITHGQGSVLSIWRQKDLRYRS